MAKVFAINALTLLRILLSAIFCIVLLHNPHPFIPCVALFALVTATDFFDGRLARKYMVQSPAGAILDVSCDLLFIISAGFVLSFQSLLPDWMLIVIGFKFLEFLLTSLFLIKRAKANLF